MCDRVCSIVDAIASIFSPTCDRLCFGGCDRVSPSQSAIAQHSKLE
ncbi:MAG: hypothetical protein KME25_01005 [Symplocastrum torsivum CPER-KK1]|uniref:Uncharacterized protein n=1 Tax=Symplocastrum torsivum CPER-KK1 TaxID=450513 RepID=A0A951PFT5_9CYAN|nr:hypothetical protein [Symplocastrum torsivum CPER-KK1]